ncbi:MAG: nucleoside-diphosphate sugar epimerase, partial [Proteobacteria bacterium]|nr:nucleoside-diphosphate sugar epimerase [Pseudomonadota bacterium]
SNEEIEDARQTKKNKNVLAVILGGPNKYYNFSLKELKNIFTYIDQHFLSNFSQLLIVSSRRTPEAINSYLIDRYKNDNKVHLDNSLNRDNYIKALAHADRIIVTSDSISMISEAATTGSPIHVAQLNPVKNDYRFMKFLNLFRDLNIVKLLDEKQENWTYDKLYETKRIADLIKNKII